MKAIIICERDGSAALKTPKRWLKLSSLMWNLLERTLDHGPLGPYNSYMDNKAGFYIWIDSTCVAGPFETEAAAWDSLTPANREKWTFELGGEGGKAWFLSLPIEDFCVQYHNTMP